MNSKFLGMVGMAKKAGKLVTGEEKCADAVRSGRSRLVIIACDASDNTKKSLVNTCKYYNAEYIEYSDKAALGKYTGAQSRAAVSVNDDNFAKAILDRLD